MGASLARRLTAAACFLLLALPLSLGQARAADIHVMSSGGLTAAFKALIPAFEKETGHKVNLVLGPSMGTHEHAIPIRLKRGEPADVVLMVGYALDGLVKEGVARDKTDLAESRIGMAVKAGQPRPNIASLDAFKKALLAAPSLAYSDSASGVYIEREMYRKLGLQAELAPKSRMIVAERVGDVVARGEAAVGFQQMSELIPIKGIELLGPIPEEAQSVTMFSAGIPVASKQAELGKSLIRFLQSAAATDAIRKSGMDPVAASR